jgi:hypothetical protein
MTKYETPTDAIVAIEAILNQFDEAGRVAMCKYLLEISELTLERL